MEEKMYTVTLAYVSGKSSTLPPIPEDMLNELTRQLNQGYVWVPLRDPSTDSSYIVNTSNIEALSIKPVDNN
ncbi:hypothetical protein [Leptolyngbya phage Lbo-JY12]